MTFLSSFSIAYLFTTSARLAGVAFVWTGAIKSIAPHTFRLHLGKLGWIPNSLLPLTVSLIAGLEVGLGVALALAVSPGIVLPGTIALLVLLSSVSWWGVHSGKTTDCGCYGGYIQPSIKQSVGLNSLFAIAALGAWLFASHRISTESWKIGAVIGLALLGAGVAQAGYLYSVKNGRYLFDTNPLKVGARWRKSWGASTAEGRGEEVIFSFLGPDCPYCRQWVRFLNAINASPALPAVVGILGTSPENEKRFIEENGIRFPIVNVSPSLVARLSPGVPTTVDVVSGTVREIWIGAMPPALYDRFKRAFFPQAVGEDGQSPRLYSPVVPSRVPVPPIVPPIV